MANFEIKNPPEFSEILRKFETTDKAHADLFNAVISVLINNDIFLRKMFEDSPKIVFGPEGTEIENNTILFVTDGELPRQFSGAGYENVVLGAEPPENGDAVWAKIDKNIIPGKLTVSEEASDDAVFFAKI